MLSKDQCLVLGRGRAVSHNADGMARTGQIPGRQGAHVAGAEQVPVRKGFSHGGNGKP